MTDEELTLDWCNHQRMLRGLSRLERMPENVRSDERRDECPVAVALQQPVTRQYIDLLKRTYVYVYHPTRELVPAFGMPDFVGRTIERYDGELGHLPEDFKMAEGNTPFVKVRS